MRILVIDDEENIRKTTTIALQAMGHEACEASDGDLALKQLADNGIHVVFLDIKLAAGADGLDLLPQLLENTPNLHVVVFTAHASIETAVQAIKHGATDYVEKPFTPDQIRIVLDKIEKTRKLQDRVAELEDRLSADSPPMIDLSSASPVMREVYATARKAAASEANILLLGESGTGKTALAAEIHNHSARRQKKFVTVSCPSLTRELLASELFGHIRGSFTGAVKDSWGKVATADGGTLFLDEIGDLPLSIQPKLLRLLQEKEYERVGETTTRKADVRVIAASNHELDKAVEEGEFREDLFYRLNVITLYMPPLRERKEDLERLANAFVSHFSAQCRKPVEGFSDNAWAKIRNHHWPGNIRELRNFVERAVILADGPILEFDSPASDPGAAAQPSDDPAIQLGEMVTLREVEAAHIRRIIDQCDTMEKAARILGIDPATLYRKRKKLEQSEKQSIPKT